MGYRISWMAVQEVDKARLLATLGLVETDDADEANEAAFSLAVLPTGWAVVWANDEGFANEDRAASLSVGLGPLMAVRVNETCMHSTAALFEAGHRRWRLHHAGDERVDMLERDGQLPPQVEQIEADLRRRQAQEGDAVDHLFDVPLEAARSICGYKHDVWRFDGGEPAFTVLMPARTGDTRSWLKRLAARF